MISLANRKPTPDKERKEEKKKSLILSETQEEMNRGFRRIMEEVQSLSQQQSIEEKEVDHKERERILTAEEIRWRKKRKRTKM